MGSLRAYFAVGRALRHAALVIILAVVALACARDGSERTAHDTGRIVAVRGDPASLVIDSVRALGFRTETLRVEPESLALRVGETWPVTQLRVRVLDTRGRELPSVPLRVVIADSTVATVRRLRLHGVALGRTTLDVTSLLPRRDRPAPTTSVTVRVSP